MTLNHVLNEAKTWINPPHPGRGKSAVLVTLVGFLAGPIGVGLVLRSFVDFGLSLVLALLLMTIMGSDASTTGALVGAAWALGRVLYDNRQPSNGSPVEPAPGATVPASV